MKKDEIRILKEASKDIFKLRSDFYDYEISLSSQLFFAQKNFFQVIAGLILVILGISYSNFKFLNLDFVLLSFIFGLVTLILSINFTREAIDHRDKMLRLEKKKMTDKTELALEKIVNSLQNNSNEFFEHAESELNNIKKDPPLSYAGEIIIFTFYLSLGFLIFAFISLNMNFSLISIETLILLILVYFISFKNWVLKLTSILSINLKNHY